MGKKKRAAAEQGVFGGSGASSVAEQARIEVSKQASWKQNAADGEDAGTSAVQEDGPVEAVKGLGPEAGDEKAEETRLDAGRTSCKEEAAEEASGVTASPCPNAADGEDAGTSAVQEDGPVEAVKGLGPEAGDEKAEEKRLDAGRTSCKEEAAEEESGDTASPCPDFEIREGACTQAHDPHREVQANEGAGHADDVTQAELEAAPGALLEGTMQEDEDGMRAAEESQAESKGAGKSGDTVTDATGSNENDASVARKEPAEEGASVDPVLERAERAMNILDDFIQKSSGGARAAVMASPGVGGAMRVSPQVKVSGGVDSIKREGVLCKRGDRWMKKWVDRRVLLQFGIVSYFKLPGTHSFPRAQMILNPDSWAREVDHFDRDFAFQIGYGLEEDGGMVWTFQAKSREEARSWIDDVRAVVASVNPLVHPWGVPGEIACSTLKVVSPARGTSATDDGEIKISSPFNVQHIASGAAAAVGAAAAAVGVSSPAMAGEMDKAQGPGTGSHYKEIETKVLREVTSLHDLTEKDLEEWRDRERNWEGEQRMVAADTAAWVRSLPDDDIVAAARAGGLLEGVVKGKDAQDGSKEIPAKKGKKRAFLKSLLTSAPLPWALAHSGKG